VTWLDLLDLPVRLLSLLLAGGVFVACLLWLRSFTRASAARVSRELGIRLDRRAPLGIKDVMLGYWTGHEGEYRGARVRLDMGSRRGAPTRFQLYHARPLAFALHCDFNVSWFEPAGEVRLFGSTVEVGDLPLRCRASDEGRARALLRVERVRDGVAALKEAVAAFDAEGGFVLGHEAVTVFSYHEPPGKTVVDAMRALSAACAPPASAARAG
jgi:hypothetical protein